MEAVRLRLVFPSRRRILTNSNQSQEELKRSWFLLNPTLLPTIADVSSHIARIFNLTHSCPHGISLSMDGFVLPPFESTCILKDKDLIRVKRNEGGTSSGTVEVDGLDLINGEDVTAKNLVGTDVLLLENGELEDKTGSYQNEVEEGEMNVVDLLPSNHLAGENAGSRKRKTSKKLQKEKVKRKKEGILGGIVGLDGVNLIEVEDVEKNPADPDDLLLANGECDNGTLSYQNELEEGEVNVVDLLLVNQSAGKDAGSKKRKTTKKLRNAKTQRKGKTSTETAAVADDKKLTYGKDKTKEKQHLDTGVLRIANEEFEKDTNADQSELQEKEDNLLEGLLLVENSAVKEAVPKKRKASEELESTNHRKKKKQAGWLYRFFETDGQAEESGPCHSPNRKEKESLVARPETESDIHVGQNEPNQCSGMSSVMNVDEVEKVSNLESKHEKESAPASAERNDEFIEPITTPRSVLHEHGTKSVNAPQASQGTKKVSRSTKRTYEKRKWRKELKAEAKELLAENVLIKDKHLPKKYIATSRVEDQRHNQHDVVRPRHIRFEADEKGNDEDVQQSRVVVETCQTIGINSKRKNGKWGNEKYVYCTRSNCRASGGECLQVVTLEKPQNDPTEFNKLPLLTSCPKEGDVIAYRVLEQSPDLGPILSSFRVGKTLRLDNWSSTLLLTPIEENPVTSVESDDDAWEPHNPSNKESGAWEQLNPINKESGAWEQHNPIDKESGAWEQQHDSIDKERKHIEIDVASLYDVRIVKHAPVRGKDVDKWDSLSQVTSLKNSLLSRKREWGKVGASTSSSKQEWGKVGPGTTSSKEWGKAGPAANLSAKDWGKVDPAMTSLSKQGWGKWGSTVTSSKQECGKAGPTTSSWSSKPFNNAKQEWCKVGPNTTSPNKEWSKVGPSTTLRKKEGSNASPTTTSWSSKPFNNTNKEWGKKGPSTSSWKKEGGNAGPIASSWSSRPFNNKKQSQNGHSKSKW